MRVILLGIELINLTTAKLLAEKGYEVTIVEERTKQEVTEHFLSVFFEDQIFIKKMDKQLRELGVTLRYACKAIKFMTEEKRIRALCIINEQYETETLMADRFVAALDYKTRSVLNLLNIKSTAQFIEFSHMQHSDTLIGKSSYENLLLNVGQVLMGITAINQSAKILSDTLYNPSLSQQQNIFSKEFSLKLISNIKKSVQRFLTSYLLTN
ncbi:MAG: hypothetical protein V4525_01965 [Pseudomonadota bacterium]